MTPADELPAQASGKIEQKVIDFERLEESGLKEGQWDVVFITCVFHSLTVFPHGSPTHVFLYRMGTTLKSAGSQENFTKIDKEYVEPFFDSGPSQATLFLNLYFPPFVSYVLIF